MLFYYGIYDNNIFSSLAYSCKVLIQFWLYILEFKKNFPLFNKLFICFNLKKSIVNNVVYCYENLVYYVLVRLSQTREPHTV